MSLSQPINFETIFMHSPLGMCVSENRVIKACNLAFCEMFGYEPSALIDKSFELIYPTADEFERTGSRIIPVMLGNGHYADERIMKRANQELFWCHVSGAALERDDPHAAGIWTFEDISAKRPVTADLTPREREIAALLVEGKTSKLIARQIGLSPRTVEMHRAKLMKKFAAATSSELVHRLLGVTPSPTTGVRR
jgi:PAS domain S-box-containing protein